MRSIAFADFLIGLGILFVLEGLLFAASPAWMRRAMKSAVVTPDNILRIGRHRLGGRRPDPDLAGAAVEHDPDHGRVSAVGTFRYALGLDPRDHAQRSCWHQRNREPPAAGFSPECPAQMLAPRPGSGALWTRIPFPLLERSRHDRCQTSP